MVVWWYFICYGKCIDVLLMMYLVVWLKVYVLFNVLGSVDWINWNYIVDSIMIVEKFVNLVLLYVEIVWLLCCLIFLFEFVMLLVVDLGVCLWINLFNVNK